MELKDLQWGRVYGGISVADIGEGVVWRIEREGDYYYTIQKDRARATSDVWCSLDALAAQCVLYHLFGNPGGNNESDV